MEEWVEDKGEAKQHFCLDLLQRYQACYRTRCYGDGGSTVYNAFRFSDCAEPVSLLVLLDVGRMCSSTSVVRNVLKTRV